MTTNSGRINNDDNTACLTRFKVEFQRSGPQASILPQRACSLLEENHVPSTRHLAKDSRGFLRPKFLVLPSAMMLV